MSCYVLLPLCALPEKWFHVLEPPPALHPNHVFFIKISRFLFSQEKRKTIIIYMNGIAHACTLFYFIIYADDTILSTTIEILVKTTTNLPISDI